MLTSERSGERHRLGQHSSPMEARGVSPQIVFEPFAGLPPVELRGEASA